jgi:hypothetical protein
MNIIPNHIYITTHSAYASRYVLLCKEDSFGRLCWDANIEASSNKVFGRRKHTMSQFRGQKVVYGKIHLDILEYDYTYYLTQKCAVQKIECYWIRYRQNFMRRKAINILKIYIMHWAYKPNGVLAKRVIQSLRNDVN